MSQTLTELFKGSPSGTRTVTLFNASHVYEASIKPNLTVEMLDKFKPASEIVLFCGALVGAKLDNVNVVSVKFPG